MPTPSPIKLIAILGSVVGSMSYAEAAVTAPAKTFALNTIRASLGFLTPFSSSKSGFLHEDSSQKRRVSWDSAGASPLEMRPERIVFQTFQFSQTIATAGIWEALSSKSTVPNLTAPDKASHLFNVSASNWLDESGGVSGDRSSGLLAILAASSERSAQSFQQHKSRLFSTLSVIQKDLWNCAPTRGTGTQTKVSDGRFYVWLKGCQVAEFPTRAAAEKFSATLTQALKAPDVDLSQLKPTFVQDAPAGRLGNKTLFVIPPELAQALNQTPELLAIEWVNHLRVALGQAKLELSQAQAHMYGLEDTSDRIDGVASWYGPYFHGRITATGEVYNQYELTAASRTLPFDTYLRVTNRKNGKQVIVRINDRGPYVDEHLRVLDLSYRAATCLGSDETGIVPIDAVILKPAPGSKLRIGQKVAGVNI